MISRILATGALTGVFLLAGATAASAVDYTGGSVDATAAGPGASVTFTSPETAIDEGTTANISIDGPQAAEEGEIITASVLTGTDTFDANGVVQFDFVVPTSAQPGDTYTISVTADDGVDTYTGTAVIAIAALPGDGGAGAGDGDGLAETGGADLTPALWFGAGAIALGAAAAGVVAATRRGNRTSA